MNPTSQGRYTMNLDGSCCQDHIMRNKDKVTAINICFNCFFSISGDGFADTNHWRYDPPFRDWFLLYETSTTAVKNWQRYLADPACRRYEDWVSGGY